MENAHCINSRWIEKYKDKEEIERQNQKIENRCKQKEEERGGMKNWKMGRGRRERGGR